MNQQVRILVAENDRQALGQLALLLEAAGYQPLTAINGLSAFDIFTRDKPSIVVTDINMPEGDGWELCAKVKQYDPDTLVIFMTASDGKPPAHCLYHPDFILTKPIPTDRLLEIIAEYVQSCSLAKAS